MKTIKHQTIWSPLSQMLLEILGHGHLEWHSQLIRHNTNFQTFHRTGPYYQFWPYYLISRGFHRTLQRVRLANRGRLLLRTSGPFPFGTCICSTVETILSWTCHVYGPFEFRTSLGTSILLLIEELFFHSKLKKSYSCSVHVLFFNTFHMFHRGSILLPFCRKPVFCEKIAFLYT